MTISEMLGSGPGRHIVGDCDLILCLSWDLIGESQAISSSYCLNLLAVVVGMRVSFCLKEEEESRIYRQSLHVGQFEACKLKGTVALLITMYRHLFLIRSFATEKQIIDR